MIYEGDCWRHGAQVCNPLALSLIITLEKNKKKKKKTFSSFAVRVLGTRYYSSTIDVCLGKLRTHRLLFLLQFGHYYFAKAVWALQSLLSFLKIIIYYCLVEW